MHILAHVWNLNKYVILSYTVSHIFWESSIIQMFWVLGGNMIEEIIGYKITSEACDSMNFTLDILTDFEKILKHLNGTECELLSKLYTILIYHHYH